MLSLLSVKHSGNVSQAMKRRRVHKASVGASETSEKTLCRQENVELAREPLRHPRKPSIGKRQIKSFTDNISTC